MKFIGNLSSFLRFGLSGLLLVTVLSVGVLGWVLFRYEQQIAELQTEDSFAIASSSLLAHGLQMGQATRNILLDPSNPTAYKNHEESEKAFGELLDQMNVLADQSSSKERLIASLQAIRNEFDKDIVVQESIHKMAGNREIERAVKVLNQEQTPQWRKYRAMMLEMRNQAEEEAARHRMQANRIGLHHADHPGSHSPFLSS